MRRLITFLLCGFIAATAARAAGEERPAPAAAPLTRDDFMTAVTGSLVNHFSAEGELSLELLRTWAAPGRLARQWTVEVVEFPAVLASSMLARCRVLADGEPAAEYTLTLRATLWRDAWSARQPVAANAPFEASALDTRRVDFLRERDALPVTVGDRGFIFARSIQPNRLLTWRDISRRPLVRKGELVEVSAIDGLLNVTMKGLAMENGAAGDTVTIRNPDSKKDFAARVVAENQVQIRF
jgi:flagella basal body P-ring formation protein FlgA